MFKEPASQCGRVGRDLVACLLFVVISTDAAAQQPSTPAQAVDAFHSALTSANTAAALSLLDPELVVFEFGVVDPTMEAYAFQHLPADIDVATQTRSEVETRQVSGESGLYWVLTTYRVTGTDANGAPIDIRLMETAILRRTGDQFRIAHLHWSTDNAAYQVRAASSRSRSKQE